MWQQGSKGGGHSNRPGHCHSLGMMMINQKSNISHSYSYSHYSPSSYTGDASTLSGNSCIQLLDPVLNTKYSHHRMFTARGGERVSLSHLTSTATTRPAWEQPMTISCSPEIQLWMQSRIPTKQDKYFTPLTNNKGELSMHFFRSIFHLSFREYFEWALNSKNDLIWQLFHLPLDFQGIV